MAAVITCDECGTGLASQQVVEIAVCVHRRDTPEEGTVDYCVELCDACVDRLREAVGGAGLHVADVFTTEQSEEGR